MAGGELCSFHFELLSLSHIPFGMGKMSLLVLLILLLSERSIQVQGIRQKSVPTSLDVSEVIVIKEEGLCHKLKCPVENSTEYVNVNIKSLNVIWILHRAHVVIGGGSKEIEHLYRDYDHNKYEFIPNTAELQINNVSFQDAGVYRCIVEFVIGIGNGSRYHYLYQTAAVELVLTSAPSQQFKGDMTRGLVTAAAALSFFCLTCIIYSCRWKEPKMEKLNNETSTTEVCGVTGECFSDWDAACGESKSSSDKDNVTYNVSDSDSEDYMKISGKASFQEPSATSSAYSVSQKEKKIFIISSPNQKPEQEQASKHILLSDQSPTTTLRPPPATPPTSPPILCLMRNKLEEGEQDGISILTTPSISSTNHQTSLDFNTDSVLSSTSTRDIPLFHFHSAPCSTIAGSMVPTNSTCSGRGTKELSQNPSWWRNWTDCNISSCHSTPTNLDPSTITSPAITSTQIASNQAISSTSSSQQHKNSKEPFIPSSQTQNSNV